MPAAPKEPFTGFTVPVEWEGHLTLIVGRPAEPREPYVQPANAFAEGEPLACTGLLGATLEVAKREANAAGLTVIVDAYVDGSIVHGAERPSWHVVEGWAQSADTVRLSVTEDGKPPVPGQDKQVAAPC